MTKKLWAIGRAALGGVCLVGATQCSGDASGGGDKKEEGVSQDSSGTDGSSTSGDGSMSTSGEGQATADGSSVSVTSGTASTSTGAATTGAMTGGAMTGGSATGGGGGDTGETNATTSGGSGGSRATAGSNGTGGAPDCEQIECFRAIECVASCDGPVVKSGCCPCDPGTFDRVTECKATDVGTGGTSGTIGMPCYSVEGCGPNEYCSFVEGQYCGAADATATCEVRPEICTADYAPVCGCDGKTYSNACVAAGAGVGVNRAGACEDL